MKRSYVLALTVLAQTGQRGAELLNLLSTYYVPGAGYKVLDRMFHLNITRMFLEVVIIVPCNQGGEITWWEAAEWIRTWAALILKPMFSSLDRHNNN